MRKIILVGVVPPPYNGQSIAFKVLTDHLNKANVPFKTVNIAGSFTSSIKLLAIILRSLDYLLIFIRLFIYCFFSRNLVYVQVSQSRNGFRRDIWINRISKWFDSKIIGHIHGGNFNGFYEVQNTKTKERIKKELLKYDKIIVLSNNLKSMYDFQPIIQDRIVCIPNGIDKATEHSAKYIDQTKEIQILYLSNLIESKGYLIVLASLVFLKKANISFKASFCGQFDISNDQSSFNNLEEARNNFFFKIKEYNLEKEVSYKGVVTGKEKQRLLDEAHFFMLPTQYINEGQPISIIEAMRSGSVIISSNYRAIPEMIEHGKTGFLLDVISPKEIANYVVYCVNNSGLFSTISKNAIEYYNANFTEAIHCQKMLALLKKCSNWN